MNETRKIILEQQALNRKIWAKENGRMHHVDANKLIAEFMGMEAYALGYDKFSDVAEMKYHTSWDWLMPVVKKCLDVYHIEQMNDDIHFQFYDSLGDIKLTYQAVVEFINEYNQNT